MPPKVGLPVPGNSLLAMEEVSSYIPMATHTLNKKGQPLWDRPKLSMEDIPFFLDPLSEGTQAFFVALFVFSPGKNGNATWLFRLIQPVEGSSPMRCLWFLWSPTISLDY